jgi:hypothetical protein
MAATDSEYGECITAWIFPMTQAHPYWRPEMA